MENSQKKRKSSAQSPKKTIQINSPENSPKKNNSAVNFPKKNIEITSPKNIPEKNNSIVQSPVSAIKEKKKEFVKSPEKKKPEIVQGLLFLILQS